MTTHRLRMLIGCLLPLLLIFVLPLFGVSDSVALFVFIILMFGCHLLMIGGHSSHEHSSHVGDKDSRHESD